MSGDEPVQELWEPDGGVGDGGRPGFLLRAAGGER